MSLIALGCLSFGLLLLADAAELRGRFLLRRLFLGAAYLLFIPPLILLAAKSGDLGLGAVPRLLGAGLALLCLILIFFSLGLELRGSSPAPGKAKVLVTRGSYAFCRHPGVLGYLGFHLGLAAALDSRGLLLALPFWAACDLGTAYIEDRFVFPRLFGEAYEAYRSRVPFVLPRLGARPEPGKDSGRTGSRGAPPPRV